MKFGKITTGTVQGYYKGDQTYTYEKYEVEIKIKNPNKWQRELTEHHLGLIKQCELGEADLMGWSVKSVNRETRTPEVIVLYTEKRVYG